MADLPIDQFTQYEPRLKVLDSGAFTCAIDGMRYRKKDLRVRWDGVIVYKKNLESRHPQDLIKAVEKEDSTLMQPESGLNSDQADEYQYDDGLRITDADRAAL